MDFQQIRKYVKGVLTNSFLNKTTLDKLSTSDAGNLLFDGKEINSGSNGSETSNSFYLIDYNSMESVNSRDFTAEKDCYIEVETYANDNKEEHYYINDIFVGRESINGEVIYLKSFFLNKGDNIKLREGVSHNTTIRIFDLLNNKHTYSTEEKVVGKWIDGKPIYEKTFSSITITNNTDNFVSDNFGDKALRHFQIDFNGISNNLTSSNNYSDTLFINTSNQLMYYISRTGSWWNGLNTANITVQYTKTTD